MRATHFFAVLMMITSASSCSKSLEKPHEKETDDRRIIRIIKYDSNDQEIVRSEFTYNGDDYSYIDYLMGVPNSKVEYTVRKDVTECRKYGYESNTWKYSGKSITEYDQGRIIKTSSYGPNNQKTGQSEFTYTYNGDDYSYIISSMGVPYGKVEYTVRKDVTEWKTYRYEKSTWVYSEKSIAEYDHGRIVKKSTYSPNNKETHRAEYTYNGDDYSYILYSMGVPYWKVEYTVRKDVTEWKTYGYESSSWIYAGKNITEYESK